MTEIYKQWTKEDIANFVAEHDLAESVYTDLVRFCELAMGVSITYESSPAPEGKEPARVGVLTVKMRMYEVDEEEEDG